MSECVPSPSFACVCVRACMSVPTCVTSGRAIMLDTGMTMITVCHALTRGDEGPGGCSLCHDKPRTRPVTPSTPQTPATAPHPRTHSHPCTPPKLQPCATATYWTNSKSHQILKEHFAWRQELGGCCRNGIIGYFGVTVRCFVSKCSQKLTLLGSNVTHPSCEIQIHASLILNLWIHYINKIP